MRDPKQKKGPAGPRPLGEAISQLIIERGLAGSSGLESLRELWADVAGTSVAARTRVVGLKSGTLEIGVNSSALLNELVGCYSDEFLQAVQRDERGKRIKTIRYRLKR